MSLLRLLISDDTTATPDGLIDAVIDGDRTHHPQGPAVTLARSSEDPQVLAALAATVRHDRDPLLPVLLSREPLTDETGLALLDRFPQTEELMVTAAASPSSAVAEQAAAWLLRNGPVSGPSLSTLARRLASRPEALARLASRRWALHAVLDRDLVDGGRETDLTLGMLGQAFADHADGRYPDDLTSAGTAERDAAAIASALTQRVGWLPQDPTRRALALWLLHPAVSFVRRWPTLAAQLDETYQRLPAARPDVDDLPVPMLVCDVVPSEVTARIVELLSAAAGECGAGWPLVAELAADWQGTLAALAVAVAELAGGPSTVAADGPARLPAAR